MKKMFITAFIAMTLIGTQAQANSYIDMIKNAGTDLVFRALDGDITAKDIGRTAVHVATTSASTPAVVYGAGALGVNATTGTAIATLNGAAAVSATSYAIGAPVVSVLGIAAAPAVVGGVIIVGAATLVAVGINAIFFSDD